MDDLKDTVSERLRDLFEGETDEMTASKLLMSPANLNKIKNGKQLPTAETLKLISQKYDVSVDWLLGIKGDMDINSVNLKSLSYEQVFALINELYMSNTLEVADLGTKKKPRLDPDYLKVNDPALSFMLRRRLSLIGVDEIYFEDWVEKHLPQYKGAPLLICDKEMLDFFLKDKNLSSYKEGDWVSRIKEYEKKTQSMDDKGDE